MPCVYSSGDVDFEVGDDAPSVRALGVERLFGQRGLVVMCGGVRRGLGVLVLGFFLGGWLDGRTRDQILRADGGRGNC